MQIEIRHSSSCIEQQDLSFVKEIISRNFVGSGELTDRLQGELATYSHNEYCIAVNSGSNALLAALLGIRRRVPEKSEVITSCYVCPSVIQSMVRAGLKPVLADINEHDLNMNVADALSRINRKTLGIVAVHMGGAPVDVASLSECPVAVIEDCAQGIGSKAHLRQSQGVSKTPQTREG